MPAGRTQAKAGGSSRSARTRDGIRALRELAIVVSLRSDRASERTARIASALQTRDHGAEVVARLPAQFLPRARVVVDPVDAGEHLPAPARVLRLVSRRPSTHDRRRVHAQLREIL